MLPWACVLWKFFCLWTRDQSVLRTLTDLRGLLENLYFSDFSHVEQYKCCSLWFIVASSQRFQFLHPPFNLNHLGLDRCDFYGIDTTQYCIPGNCLQAVQERDCLMTLDLSCILFCGSQATLLTFPAFCGWIRPWAVQVHASWSVWSESLWKSW